MTQYNPFTLEGKTILITGASSGIGQATAVACSRMGARMVITGRNAERLAQTFDSLSGNGHLQLIADLNDSVQLEALVTTVPQLNGAVLCAGVGSMMPVTFATRKKFDAIFETNFFSQVELNRLLLKKKKYSEDCSIVGVSSAAALTATPGNGIYGASKAALSTWLQYVALEYRKKGLRFNCVNPGMVETPFITDGVLSKEDFDADKPKYLKQRYGRPEDVANAIIFLLSDAASWITGIEMPVDGGMTLNN